MSVTEQQSTEDYRSSQLRVLVTIPGNESTLVMWFFGQNPVCGVTTGVDRESGRRVKPGSSISVFPRLIKAHMEALERKCRALLSEE
jgi:hypothetical protein